MSTGPEQAAKRFLLQAFPHRYDEAGVIVSSVDEDLRLGTLAYLTDQPGWTTDDTDALAALARLSGGERAALKLAASLAGHAVDVNLWRELSRLDQPRRDAFALAVAEAVQP